MPLQLIGEKGSGTSVTLTVAAGTPTAYAIPVSLVDPPADLQAWDLEYKLKSTETWLVYATGLTATTQSLADLDAATAYDFRARGHVLVEALSNVGEATTAVAPARIIQRSAWLPAAYGNGMLLATGTAPVEGVIPAQGRSYTGGFRRMRIGGSYTAYGIRFALANQRSVPISGGKMLVGINRVETDTIGTDPFTNWVQVTVGNDPLLPVPAQTASRMGLVLTDPVYFPGGHIMNPGSIGWRFWHPGQDEETDYALTYAVWGANPWERLGTLMGAGIGFTEGLAGEGVPRTYYSYTDADAVTVPETIRTWGTAPPSEGSQDYGPPGPGSRPWMHAMILTEAP